MEDPFIRLGRAATAAVHALRSYQYGNAAPELAEEVADELESALSDGPANYDSMLLTINSEVKKLKEILEEALQRLSQPSEKRGGGIGGTAPTIEERSG